MLPLITIEPGEFKILVSFPDKKWTIKLKSHDLEIKEAWVCVNAPPGNTIDL